MPTKLSNVSIPTGRHGSEVRIRIAVCYRDNRQCLGRTPVIAIDTPPQLQLIVNEGLQYAVLAKCVNGVNASISVELSVVIA
jgi:hypothetical protein